MASVDVSLKEMTASVEGVSGAAAVDHRGRMVVGAELREFRLCAQLADV